MKFSKVNEVVLKDPATSGSFEDPDFKEKIKGHMAWRHGLYQTMRRLTGATGQWHIGSSQDDVINKLKELVPSEYSAVRSKVASIAAKQRQINAMVKQVQAEAKALIDELDKDKK